MLYIVCLFFCVAIVSAQVPAARTVFAAQTGLLNGRACYIVSAEYAVIPNSSVRGNVFAAAMGINTPGSTILSPQLYPWTAVAYAKGSIDATTYPISGNISTLHVQAEASANVLAWAYAAIGEFCDVNGKEGYQKDTTDYIINYYTAPQALFYDMNCGQELDPITGANSYYGSIQTSFNQYFNVTCRVFPTNSTMRNGRIVSPYDFKCDIRIDYSLLWTNDTAKINSCADNKRKIGLLLNVAGASFDVDVSADVNLNGAPVNSPDGERITFGSGKLQFSWDNYYVKTGSFAAVTGTNGVLTAAYIGRQTLNASTNIYGAAIVEQIIFSFDAPKSAGSIYYWDPTTTVLDTQSSSALSACLSLVALCLLSFFF